MLPSSFRRHNVTTGKNEDPHISTAQAARSLGVSVSTVKRWVDEGVLPAQKTAGGHRKLLRAEVLALARKGALPTEDLSQLVLPATRKRKSKTDWNSYREALLAAILEGHDAEVRALIHRAYRGGLSVETLADQVISPVMERVGHGWETRQIDIWHEHRGTLMVAAALFDLQSEIGRRAEQRRPVALGGAPASDPYVLSSLLAQLVLLDSGWQAINLGPNTPMESFVKAVQDLRPKLIWISASHIPDETQFQREYAALHRAAEQYGAGIALGGRALTEPVRAKLHYASYGDGLSHLAAFARSLHPRPQRPRRGRPPKMMS